MDGSMIGVGVGIGLGFAGLGCGIGQGMAANGATLGVARQPEAANSIRTTMLIGMAFVESILIFCWVVLFLMASKVPSIADQQKTTASVVRTSPTQVALNSDSQH